MNLFAFSAVYIGETGFLFQKREVNTQNFVAQLTDTHCRYLAVARTEEGVRNYITLTGPYRSKREKWHWEPV